MGPHFAHSFCLPLAAPIILGVAGRLLESGVGDLCVRFLGVMLDVEAEPLLLVLLKDG